MFSLRIDLSSFANWSLEGLGFKDFILGRLIILNLAVKLALWLRAIRKIWFWQLERASSSGLIPNPKDHSVLKPSASDL